jgi:hypothetical protein
MQSNDAIEKFFRENRDKFSDYCPRDNHLEKFFYRLNYKIRQITSIVPHLIRVLVTTVFVFAASILIWNTFIRKDRHEISLQDKISLVISKIKRLSN